jgi:hypothetical protein
MFHRLFRVLLAGLMLCVAMMGCCCAVCVCSLLVKFCRSLVRVMSYSFSSNSLPNLNPVYTRYRADATIPLAEAMLSTYGEHVTGREMELSQPTNSA